MAEAMRYAVLAGRNSYLSGRIEKTIFGKTSSPNKGII
jgi:thiazole synthase